MTPTVEIRQTINKFEGLTRQGNLTAENASILAERAAKLVIEYHHQVGGCLREAINLICEIATHQDSEIARAGITALFPSLVERLNDSFDPAACRLYDQLFAQVIEFCRHLPEGEKLDEGLKRFGLLNEFDLLSRKSAIQIQKAWSQFTIPKKVLLPSRVTIGADVVVTSTIIAKLRQTMPQAEFVILGSRKLRELYGGDPQIRIREIAYERGGSLISRLTSWLDAVEAVNKERQGVDQGEFWVVDPDSRITQLGLLPLIENDENYFFFESRSYQPDGEATSIGQLAARWCGELLGNYEPSYPFVNLPVEHQKFGRVIAKSIRKQQTTTCNLVTISFGVGGNQSKRFSAEFEQNLVERLLTDSKLILDKGGSQEEREQINLIVAHMLGQGRKVVELTETNKNQIAEKDLVQADVVTWDGGIGAFAGLIAESNQYIGYDSAGQHIAAALGVPTQTFFVSSNNTTFAERWRPFGKDSSNTQFSKA